MSWSLDVSQVRTVISPVTQRDGVVMTKKTEVTSSALSLFDPYVAGVLLELSDPLLCIEHELVTGQCPGIRDLETGLWPPRNLHKNDVPVDFSIKVGPRSRVFKLKLMAYLVYDNGDDAVVVGFISHDQNEEVFEHTVEAKKMSVAVRYSPVTRQGVAYLYNEVSEHLQQHVT